MISAQIAADYKETFNNEFYNIFFTKGFLDLPPIALDEAYREVTQAFDGESKENLKQITEDDFLKFVDELIDKVDPVKQALRVVAEERSLKEAAEKENIMLRAIIANHGQPIPLEAQVVKAESVADELVTRRRPMTRLFAAPSTAGGLVPTRRPRIINSEPQTISASEPRAKIRRR